MHPIQSGLLRSSEQQQLLLCLFECDAKKKSTALLRKFITKNQKAAACATRKKLRFLCLLACVLRAFIPCVFAWDSACVLRAFGVCFACAFRECQNSQKAHELKIYIVPMQLQHVATRCNTPQHAATRCNTLQHAATHCNTLQHTATHCGTLQHTATRCNALKNAATHCNTPLTFVLAASHVSFDVSCDFFFVHMCWSILRKIPEKIHRYLVVEPTSF